MENMDQPQELNQEDSLKQKKEKKPRSGNFRWILGGIAFIILLIVLGGLLGWQNGIQLRLKQEQDSKLGWAAFQYELAMGDISDQRYAIAQQRLEAVILEVPDYPGAADKLVEVMVAIGNIKSPTPVPTATPTQIPATPTPDFRGEEDMLNAAKAAVAASNWEAAIEALDALRTKNFNFHPLDLDGLYYIALRNRGIEKILYKASLEPGIYDITLAERFAPLDRDAVGYRNWARSYLTGASFWEVDWNQVVYYFGDIYNLGMPDLTDGFMSVRERYRIGLIHLGDQLLAAGDPCAAKEKYELSLGIAEDALARDGFNRAGNECNPPAPVVPPTETPTMTPDPGALPTEAPTEVPTEEPTPDP